MKFDSEKLRLLSSIRRTLSDVGFSLLEEKADWVYITMALDKRLDGYNDIFGEHSYRTFIKSLDGEMIGVGVGYIPEGSSKARVVDEVYFRQPYVKLIDDLKRNIYQIRNYQNVLDKALEMREEDLNQAAFFLSFYTAPRAYFRDGRLHEAKISDIFTNLRVAKGILKGELGTYAKVREYSDDYVKVYRLSQDKLVEISSPTFFETCSPHTVSLKKMFGSFRAQHPNWESEDSDEFTPDYWCSEYGSCLPLYESFDGYNVIFLTEEQKKNLSEKVCFRKYRNYTGRSLVTLDDIDEIFVLKDGEWHSEPLDKQESATVNEQSR